MTVNDTGGLYPVPGKSEGSAMFVLFSLGGITSVGKFQGLSSEVLDELSDELAYEGIPG